MQPLEKLEQAISFIDTSRREVELGEVVQLEGFQHDVQAIHKEIAAMPVEEAKIYKPKVSELFDKLQLLERELVAQQHKVQQEIFALNRRQKALKSYETTGSTKDEDGD